MMHIRSIFASFGVVVALFLLLVSSSNVQADTTSSESDDSGYRKILEKMEEGLRGPIAEWHYYWHEGLRIGSPEKNLTIKINLSIMVDGGYIGADDELENAFPDLEGPNLNFRELKVSIFGTIYDWAEVKLGIDFANVQDIKDQWIRFTKIPYIGHITLCYMKEPFSLEELTSLKYVTFMDSALPVLAFTPGRNIGIRYHTAALDKRMTWHVGAFLNTGSFSTVGESKDQISEASGYNLTGRITYLPWYEDNGKRLLHLGLSYSHQFRDPLDTRIPEQFRARPESALTDDRLVDTGKFLSDGANLINPELASVSGPLSLQGEYFHVFEDARPLGKPDFWGFYLFGSYLITGESRRYDTSTGAFSHLQPKHNFSPRLGGWGA